jgi:DNA anti-recombination protein RmuC
VPAPSGPKGTKDVAPTGATTSADSTSADVAQSLKTIAQGLAGINDKLEQLKSSHEQTLREHADSIQQLKTAQEQSVRDNARIAEQIQALQAQLATLSAKSSGQSVKKENEAAARQRVPTAAPPRPNRPRAPWRPPPYMDGPWDYPDW